MPSVLGFKNPEQSILTVVVLFFTVLFVTAWLTAVGGVGKLDKDCDFNGCKSDFRDHWWALFFELLTYVFMFGSMLTGTLNSARGAVLTFLALTAVNTEDLAERYLDFRDLNDRGGGNFSQLYENYDFQESSGNEDAINAGIAGFILLTMCNFVFILVVGINADLAQAMERLKTFKQRWQTPQQPQQPQQPHMQQFPQQQQPMPMPVGKPDAPYAGAPGQMPPPPNMPPPNMPPPNMPPPNMPPPNMPPPNMPPPNMPPPNVPPQNV